MFKRKRKERLPDELTRAFMRTAVLVDEAQRALVAAVPTSRDPGIPVADAIDAFDQRLELARASMTAWRDDRLAHEWTKCSDVLREAHENANQLRLEAGLTFEQLNARVGDVLYPLESFADVEREIRRR
jgi:hypothetical protein